MGYLLSRLNFAEEQFDKILEKSKKTKRKYVIIKYFTGIELTFCLGTFLSKDATGIFSSMTTTKDVISLFPFTLFFWCMISILFLVIVPLIFIVPILYVYVYWFVMLGVMIGATSWLSNDKRTKFGDFIVKLIPKIYPLSLYRTLKLMKKTSIHEIVHFYDKRLDLLTYDNFKFVSSDSINKTYYNKITEMNAHVVVRLYELKNKNFKSFELFYKSVSKHIMFDYLTDKNKRIVYEHLDEYYHELKKENQI